MDLEWSGVFSDGGLVPVSIRAVETKTRFFPRFEQGRGPLE
jgi:hypothetical protein